MTSYAQLHEAAQASLAASTRVIVQVGHCSQAVGATQVAEALQVELSGHSSVDLVIAGCDGACFAAPQVIVTTRSNNIQRYSQVSLDDVPALAATLTRGDAAQSPPFVTGGGGDLDSFFAAQTRLLLTRCGYIDPTSINEYIALGGYRGLNAALSRSPEEVIQTVLDAGLLGRGGAYFPAARKWQAARAANGSPRYLVVNAEEGEPGLFKDRHIMEGDPHLLLEGMLIAAYATGASETYIYVNAEANLSAQRIETAIEQAQDAGLIGDNILGSGFDCQVTVRRGAGGYVCGEETTLLDTIQGNRREPRLRPPFPAESGLFQRPTVINNVETLSNVPMILDSSVPSVPPEPVEGQPESEFPVLPPFVKGGRGGFSDHGLDSAKGTKLICLSGSVQRPGLAEVPMGSTLRHVIYDIGGGPPPGTDLGVLAVGGPSSGVLPPTELDTELRPGMLHPSGVVMGAGGIMVMAEGVPVIDVVRQLAAYNAAESCGKCTPCREGTPRMVQVLDRLASGSAANTDLEELRYLAEIVGAASLCGLGQMAGGPINSALHFFGDELEKLAE
ncbi:MAG: SLBB domain-containing protein [Dehalococcoidia bacterium]|nr:SLBB domain-containing protein [Dehalococcoidia bacterium]